MEINKTQQPKTSKNVVIVGFLSFFGGISQDIFSPILPIYLTTILGFDKALVGVAEGVVSAGSYVFKILAGHLSDKFGKQKPIIFLGYFISMVSRVFLVLASSVMGVVGLRLLDGAGKGIKDPPKDVLIAGSSEKENRGRSFGVARMLDTLGSAVGPLILFVLIYFFQNNPRFYHNILLFTAVPLIITLFLIFKLKELPREKPTKREVFGAKGRCPNPFMFFCLLLLFFP